MKTGASFIICKCGINTKLSWIRQKYIILLVEMRMDSQKEIFIWGPNISILTIALRQELFESLFIFYFREMFKHPGAYWVFSLSPSCSGCHAFSKVSQLVVLRLLFLPLVGHCLVCIPSPSARPSSVPGRFPERRQTARVVICWAN